MNSPWAHWDIIIIRTAVSVSAQQPWVDTGVDLKAGEALTISAKGTWSFERGGKPYGPDGCDFELTNTTLNSAKVAALIGRVGNQMFFVGSAYRGTSPAAGRLYLQINDDPKALTDNSGTLNVEVKRNQ